MGANDLASRYTVVTYDPRGLSHSRLSAPLDDWRMVQVFADDVHRLLDKEANGKSFVFANSGAAAIALELAARHSEQLETLVARASRPRRWRSPWRSRLRSLGLWHSGLGRHVHTQVDPPSRSTKRHDDRSRPVCAARSAH